MPGFSIGTYSADSFLIKVSGTAKITTSANASASSTGVTFNPRSFSIRSTAGGKVSTNLTSNLSGNFVTRLLDVRVPIFPPAPMTATLIFSIFMPLSFNKILFDRNYFPKVSFTVAAIFSGAYP